MQFNQAPAPRESSLGDAYDPTASYSVDDLCIHDNVLYKCIVPISGGEAWNSEHWTETNIGDEISAVKSKMWQFRDVNIGDVTLTSQGFQNIISHKPSDIATRIKLVTIYSWESASPVTCFNVSATGNYIFGSANQTIKNMILRYYYL